MSQPLAELHHGEKARVMALEPDRGARQRLSAFGRGLALKVHAEWKGR